MPRCKVDPMNTAHEWLANLTDDSQNEAARRAGIPERTLYNQLGKGSLSVENVLKLAEAYDLHPIRALIDTCNVDPRWENVEDVKAALKAATPQELANEMLDRLEQAEASGTTVDDEFNTPVDELARRREEQSEWGDAVADGSPDEDELRGDDFD